MSITPAHTGMRLYATRHPGRPRHHRRLAVVGLACVLAVAATSCTGVRIPEAVDDFARSQGLPLDGTRKYPDELAVGDCLQEPTEEDLLAVRVVDCSGGHGGELIHHIHPGDPGEYPGVPVEYPGDAAEDWLDVEEQCIPALESYVGEAYEDSEWDFGTLIPTRQAWAMGDRSVQCILVHMEAATWSGSPASGEVTLQRMADSAEPDEDTTSS